MDADEAAVEREDLAGADLRDTDLTGRDLRHAILRGATLRGMRLDGLNLAGADLTGADFTGVTMTGGSLRGATFTGSQWQHAAILGTEGTDPLDLEDRGLVLPRELDAAAIAGRDHAEAEIDSRALPGHVAFSPDGALLALWGSAEIKIADSRTGTVLRVLRGHEYEVTSVAFAPDATLLASGSTDGSARVWDLGAGDQRAILPGRDSATVHSFSPDGTVLAASVSGKAVAWDMATGQPRPLPGLDPFVPSPAGRSVFSPDGRHVITGACGPAVRGVRIRDAATGHETAALTGHRLSVGSAGFSPDGTLIATASIDGTIKTWDAATGTPRATFSMPGFEYAGPCAVMFSRDNALLIGLAPSALTVQAWSAATGRLVTTLTVPDALNGEMALSPDGALVAARSADGTVRTWRIATGELVAAIPDAGPATTFTGYPLVFSPDASRLATGGARDPVRIWDVATGRLLATFGEAPPASGWKAAFSADGRFLATVHRGHAPVVWDTRTGTRIAAPALGAGTAALADGKSFIPCVTSDGTVTIRPLGVSRRAYGYPPHSSYQDVVALSPDGSLLATSSVHGVLIWDAAGRTMLAELADSKGPTGIAFSPDGSRIAVARGRYSDWSRIWDVSGVSASRPRSRLGHRESQRTVVQPAAGGLGCKTWDVAFHPDGDLIASTSRTGEVQVWSLSSHSALTTVTWRGHFMTGVAFSPDGTLASLCDGDIACLWAVEVPDATVRHIATLIPLAGDGYVTLLPDGSYKIDGDLPDRAWWTMGLRRFGPGELDPYVPAIRRVPPHAPVQSGVVAAKPGTGNGRFTGYGTL